MLAGYPPFYADNPLGIYEAILGGKIDRPQSVDGLAKDLIRKAIKKRVLNLGHCQNSVKGMSKTIYFIFLMALCRKLLVEDRTKRIWNLRNGAEDVKTRHTSGLMGWIGRMYLIGS
jgi:hypothetical protein